MTLNELNEYILSLEEIKELSELFLKLYSDKIDKAPF